MLKPYKTQMLVKMKNSAQTDNHDLRKNVETHEMYILRIMGLNFENPLNSTFYAKQHYIFLLRNANPLEFGGQSDHFLKKLKLKTK